MSNGTLKIKNVSGAPYSVEELGGVILDIGGEIDLMDEALPSHYDHWEAANAAAYTSPEGRLCQDIDAGILEVVDATPPSIHMPGRQPPVRP